MCLHAQRVRHHRARLEPQFVEPGGIASAWAVERDGLARLVEGAERAALHRHDPHAHAVLAARRRHPQLAALLDHDEQRARVEQREPAIRHQPQQPQL